MQVGINDDDLHVCQLPGCNEIDLLAAQCSYCGRRFCTAHISSGGHHCEGRRSAEVLSCPVCARVVPLEFPTQTPDDAVSRHLDRGCRDAPPGAGAAGHLSTSGAGASKSNSNSNSGGGSEGRRLAGPQWRCGVPGCGCADPLQRIVCDLCGGAFCIEHRNALSHHCPRAERKPRVTAATSTTTKEAGGSGRPRSESPATRATVAQLLQQPRNTPRTAYGKPTEAASDMVTPLVCFLVPPPAAAEASSASASASGAAAATAGAPVAFSSTESGGAAAATATSRVAAVAPFFMHISKSVVIGRALDLAVAEASKHAGAGLLKARGGGRPWSAHVIRLPVPAGATAPQYPPVPLSTVVSRSPLCAADGARDDGSGSASGSSTTTTTTVLVFSQLGELPEAVLSAVRASRLPSSRGSAENCSMM